MRTCCLVAACDFNADDFAVRWRSGAFDFVVAVDAGLERVRAAGCYPDLTVGDFDSLGYVPEGGQVQVHPVRKDKSDMELALDLAFDRGYEAVWVYGALGGRLDHTIGNLQTCAGFAERGMQVTIVGLDSAVRILVGPATFDIPFCETGTVSVFSAVDESVGVTECGMEYPLEDARLSNRTTLGLSNELTGRPASVSARKGTLYVFYPL